MDTDQLLEYRAVLGARPQEDRKPDGHARKLLLYLFAGTRGGYTRLRIVMLLLKRSYNTHQLALATNLDYKAVKHHIRVLEKNNLISGSGLKYGAEFHLSPFLEVNLSALDEVIEKLMRSASYKKVYL